MKRLRKLFRSRSLETATPYDSHIIYEIMEQIDEAIKKTFDCNAIELLREPIANIVPAVWCVPTHQDRLTYIQRQIQCTIYPMILKIHDALKTGKLAGTKDLMVDYLIKKLVIIELAFMVQSYKLNLIALGQSKAMDINNLTDTEVVGHA